MSKDYTNYASYSLDPSIRSKSRYVASFTKMLKDRHLRRTLHGLQLVGPILDLFLQLEDLFASEGPAPGLQLMEGLKAKGRQSGALWILLLGVIHETLRQFRHLIPRGLIATQLSPQNSRVFFVTL